MRARIRVSVLLVGTLLLAALPTLNVQADGTAIFGTAETFTPDITRFYKWAGMLQRWHAAEADAVTFCASGESEHCMPREWLRLVSLLRPLDTMAKVQAVNAIINRYPYVASQTNWHEINYWETPFEFLTHSGQCQDYATTKYLLLRAAGVPASQLRIVVLRDQRQSADHAVLVAYVEGETLMLDNQFADVVPTDRAPYYQPYYSINETGWWLHTPNPLMVATVSVR